MPQGAARVGRPKGSKSARKWLVVRKQHRQEHDHGETAESLLLSGYVLGYITVFGSGSLRERLISAQQPGRRRVFVLCL